MKKTMRSAQIFLLVSIMLLIAALLYPPIGLPHTPVANKTSVIVEIPDGYMKRAEDAFAGTYRIDMVLSDPEDPESELVPQYTKAEWVPEQLWLHVQRTTYNYEKNIGIRNAAKAVTRIERD